MHLERFGHREDRFLKAALLASLALSASAMAGGDAALEPGEPASGEGEIWEFKPHHLSALTAFTYSEDGEGAFTFGVDYEYRVNAFVGIGTVIEHAYKPFKATTILAAVDLHVWKGLAIQTGPGVVIEEEHEFFAYRLGAIYEFELAGGLTLSPQLHYDFIDGTGNEWIAALAFGTNF